MKYIKPFGDERTLAFCAFCGGKPDTNDHCPSRVFLDEPYPEQLPVVRACLSCNNGFSLDEEYLACLLSCVIAGSTAPEAILREKIRLILEKKPFLRAHIEDGCTLIGGRPVFNPEHGRVHTVVVKLAQGHALYECHENYAHTPNKVIVLPLSLMSDSQREAFDNPPPPDVWPEVGSRGMQRMVVGDGSENDEWIDVQTGRYRYCVAANSGIEVRIVIQEYLACYVRWNH